MDFFIGTPLILILFVIYYMVYLNLAFTHTLYRGSLGFTLNVGAYNT